MVRSTTTVSRMSRRSVRDIRHGTASSGWWGGGVGAHFPAVSRAAPMGACLFPSRFRVSWCMERREYYWSVIVVVASPRHPFAHTSLAQ
jgi:hypothetical protein